MKPVFWALAFTLLACCAAPQQEDHLLEQLMKGRPEFSHVLENRDSLEIQIIYTQIDRDEQNQPRFRSFYFNADSSRYFYPASTIKLPMVLLALEKINRLSQPRLTEHSTMLHDSVYRGQQSARTDTTSATGLPSIDHYTKKILVVSDNDASNRLYEFVGQQEVNKSLNERGYTSRMVHRLERPLTPDENRHTEAVRFFDEHGALVYRQPMLVNPDSLHPLIRAQKGRGFLRNGQVVNEPLDFTYKNYYPLNVQQRLLRAIIFPDAVAEQQRFQLTDAQRKSVLQYMSQLPRETAYPAYHRDTTLYDAYCKFLMYGEEREPIPANIRIFNKVGDAYGYLIDNAYIVDFENDVEFFLSAVIYCNSDGILNDGRYDYETTGFPFLRDLGRVVYEYDRNRPRTRKPDLTEFRLTYDRP
jgi:hypothetical protein